MITKNKEKMLLAIIGLSLGGAGLLLGLIPFVGWFFFLFIIAGIVLSIIAMVQNRDNKKALSLTALIVSGVAFFIILFAQICYIAFASIAAKNINNTINTSQTYDSSSSSSDNYNSDADADPAHTDTNAPFKWTKSDFNRLVVGDSETGVGGDSYTAILQKFGKAYSITDSDNQREVIYQDPNGNGYVDLTFTQQDNGSYLLSDKYSDGL
ncbi:MAG: hypothetical protein FWF42_02425 [Streptococcaceae bacterium]|nr:hypothetical protein [Streptococcaceae bacterium]